MNEVGGKSAFHQRPATPSKPALSAPARPRPASIAAESKGLDPRVIWLAGAAGAFVIAWAALGAAIAFILVFASGLGWLLHARHRQSARTTRPTTPSRKAGWALISLLVVLAAVFFWNSARLAADLASPEARKLAAISTSSTLLRYAPEQAAAGLGTLHSMRQASDLSLWLGVGAIGLAILGAIIMVATQPRADHAMTDPEATR